VSNIIAKLAIAIVVAAVVGLIAYRIRSGGEAI
jgi:hypothetical protein